MTTTGPALFFCVNGEFLIHSCPIEEGEQYGDFVNYPYSHDMIWQEHYAKRYHVDFDYFPRGRVVYRKSDDVCLIYYDKCIASCIGEVASLYGRYHAELDEHYQCAKCNPFYMV